MTIWIMPELYREGWAVCVGSKAANTMRLHRQEKLVRLRAPLGDLWTPLSKKKGNKEGATTGSPDN